LGKDDLVYAGHMLDLAQEAIRLMAGKSRSAFERDRTLSLALTHLLQTIGEAARHVSPQFRSEHPGIPWAAIVGLRHRVVHDYMYVDLDIVWDVVTRDLDPLIAQLKPLLPGE
jgi:uncharacterized protein with HEPN domain